MSQCNFDRKVPAPTRWKLWLHRRVNGPDGDADPIGDFEPARLAERCRAATHFCVKEIRLNGLMRKVLPALQARGVPVHIVHLVRDPRAVFMSERRVFKPGTNEGTPRCFVPALRHPAHPPLSQPPRSTPSAGRPSRTTSSGATAPTRPGCSTPPCASRT